MDVWPDRNPVRDPRVLGPKTRSRGSHGGMTGYLLRSPVEDHRRTIQGERRLFNSGGFMTIIFDPDVAGRKNYVHLNPGFPVI